LIGAWPQKPCRPERSGEPESRNDRTIVGITQSREGEYQLDYLIQGSGSFQPQLVSFLMAQLIASASSP